MNILDWIKEYSECPFDCFITFSSTPEALEAKALAHIEWHKQKGDDVGKDF